MPKSCLFVCFPNQKKAKGEELFDQIMYHLDIVEKDYFGLRFMDSAQVPVRMELHFTQKFINDFELLAFLFLRFVSLPYYGLFVLYNQNL